MPSILITGASSGFGKNVALALASAGWRVFASMRDLAKGEALRAEAQASGFGERLSLHKLDVTDPACVEAAVKDVLAATGGNLDAVLANAGYGAMGAFEDLSDEDCRQQMETNFFGALALARAVIPVMRKAQSGRIVLVSSNAVNTPHPLMSMYAASKWALEGWAEALSMELAPFGVEVRVVQPGAHRTPFAEHVVPRLNEDSPYKDWIQAVMPGLSDLDQWGRKPETATEAIVRAVCEDAAPFHVRIGEDTVGFSALKASASYEVRAWVVRSLIGAPEPNAYTDRRAPVTSRPVLTDVIRRLAGAAERRPEEVAQLGADLIAAKSASHG